MSLTTKGAEFFLDGQPFDMWGLRVASGAYSDSDTEEFLAAMPEYSRYGINTITVFYQGCSGGFCQAFSPDGKGVDRNIAHRFERILSRAEQLGMVVVVGVFYERGNFLESGDAYLRAAELVARTMKGRPNVALNLVNEQNVKRWADCPYPFREPEAVGRICAVAKSEAPDLLVGGGGFWPEWNLSLAKDPRLDVLWFDDQAYPDTCHLYQDQGLDKPHVNVETYGPYAAGFVTLADGSQVQGVFPQRSRNKLRGQDDFRTAIKSTVGLPGFYLFGHLQAWFQGRSRGFECNRYDVAGEGTLDDPGIHWYLRAVAEARGL